MKKRIFIKILIIALFILFIDTKVSNAAISASNRTVNSGDSISISITSNVPVLSYKITMNGSGGLTFVTSSGGTGAGTATITDAKATGMTSLATYTFRAPTVTTDTTYTISFTATAMEDENFNAVANSTATATIKVKAPSAPISNSGGSSGGGTSSSSGSGSNNKPTTNTPETKKSNDATLKGLTIEGIELYPEFNSQTKEYNIKVGNDITSINIIPVANDSKATCSLEGKYQELEVGANTVNVIVTAEDGTTNRYIITVTRERELLKLMTLNISYIDEEGNAVELPLTPELNEETFEYSLPNLPYMISKLNIEAIANLKEAKIEIQGNDQLSEGENTITVTITMPSESEEEQDEVLNYILKVNKEKEPVVTLMGKIKNWFKGITGTVGTWYTKNQYKVIMGALTLCSAIMGGLVVYLTIEYKKYRLLIQKVSEITRMNSSSQTVTEATNGSETIEIEKNSNGEATSKGKHF